MRKLIVMLLLVLAASSVMAALGWFAEYILVSPNSGADVWYYIGDGTEPIGSQFDSADLGTFSEGLTLEFGADIRYWSDSQDRDGGAFYWVIDGGTSPNEVIWTHTYLGGNDFLGTEPTTHDVASGLGVGAHTVSIWAKSWGTGQGDSWLNNGGANYNATFTIIPEPTTMILVGLGVAGLLVYRRRG